MLTARYLLRWRCKWGGFFHLFARFAVFALFALFFDGAKERFGCKWISIVKVRTRSMNLFGNSIARLFYFGKESRHPEHFYIAHFVLRGDLR